MRIASRILVGFGLVILLLAVTGAFFWLGALRSVENLDALGAQSNRLATVNALNRQILELQRHVQIFADTAHPAHAKRVRDSGSEIGLSLDQLGELIENDREVEIHKKLLDFQAKYMEAFGRLVEDRYRRDRLLDESRVSVGEIQDALSGLSVNRAGSSAVEAAAKFAQASQSAALYVDRPDSGHAREAKTAIRAAMSAMSEMGEAGLVQKTKAYENTLVQMIQSIRGYLFLNNVVLAGQALEFSTHISELKALFEEQERATYTELERNARGVVVFSVVTVVGALLIGIISSFFIGRSIAGPLGEIASTLRRLGQGESVDQVPGLGRADEIGEMATAAQVFKERNEQTQSLLASSDRDRAQLSAQAHELQTANAELEQFAYVASHDLQEPLRVVSSYVELLRERYQGQLDAEADIFIGFASDGAHRMQQLIRDLLDFSRAGNLKEEAFQECDSRAILDAVLSDLETQLDERDASVEIGNLPSLVSHPNALRSIFQNLVTNAIKYGGPDTPLSLYVDASTDGELVTFSFRDNGIGIAPQHHERIFKLFQRLHPRSEYDGTGIGLAIVAKLADELGGRIWVQSELGEGATFYVSIASRMGSA